MSRRVVLSSALGALAVAGCRDRPEGADVAGTAPTTARPGRAPITLAYGDDASQVADLTWPARSADGDVPIGVVIHGGFWRAAFDRSLGVPLAESLVAAGWAALNVEYRRVGNGGGYPATLDDVAAAVDALAGVDGIDRTRVVAIGHSAGGHLAAWLATRPEPTVAVTAVVAQAGVLDLRRASADRLGAGAVDAFLGGSPDDVPDRYAVADPTVNLPLGVPVLCVHGAADDIVPIGQSEGFAIAATAAGDDARLVTVDGDHFVVIDPASDAWSAVLDFLGER